MEYALSPPLTTFTACCNLTQCVTFIHSQSHTARHQSSMLKLALFQAPYQLSVGTASDQKKAAAQLVYTLPIPSLAKQLHKDLYCRYLIWSRN